MIVFPRISAGAFGWALNETLHHRLNQQTVNRPVNRDEISSRRTGRLVPCRYKHPSRQSNTVDTSVYNC